MWLTKITEAQALALEKSYKECFDKKGQKVWIKIGKKGIAKTLKSKPNYVRTRRYILKYFDYKDTLKAMAKEQCFIMPQDAFFMWYFMPMPKSWTKKKKAEMAFKMHKNKKDCDNIGKGIFDALAPRKSNFAPEKTLGIDDRVISSYANAKVYIPDGISLKPGIAIIEYDVSWFMKIWFADVIELFDLKLLPDIIKFI
jgi:Holliday junction resolvase RusA-like endonuclease